MTEIKLKAFCHGKIRDIIEIQYNEDNIEICVPDDDGFPFYTDKFTLLTERK